MDSFLSSFEKINREDVSSLIQGIGRKHGEQAINSKGKGGLGDFAALLSPIAGKEYLEDMAQLANRLTVQRFGKVMRLFAPLYLSNECNNVCDYCGFSLGNKIPRKTLSVAEMLREAGVLKKNGFEHVLLVTGESAKKVDTNYLFEAINILDDYFSNV